jgi:hypothetical protein
VPKLSRRALCRPDIKLAPKFDWNDGRTRRNVVVYRRRGPLYRAGSLQSVKSTLFGWSQIRGRLLAAARSLITSAGTMKHPPPRRVPVAVVPVEKDRGYEQLNERAGGTGSGPCQP